MKTKYSLCVYKNDYYNQSSKKRKRFICGSKTFLKNEFYINLDALHATGSLEKSSKMVQKTPYRTDTLFFI